MLRLYFAAIALALSGCAVSGEPYRSQHHGGPAPMARFYITPAPIYMPPPPPRRYAPPPAPYGYYGYRPRAPMYMGPGPRPQHGWQQPAPPPPRHGRAPLNGYEFQGRHPAPYGAPPPMQPRPYHR